MDSSIALLSPGGGHLINFYQVVLQQCPICSACYLSHSQPVHISFDIQPQRPRPICCSSPSRCSLFFFYGWEERGVSLVIYKHTHNKWPSVV